eukprot:CAMPEP_0115603602 /NCGR_PEP_ID=MMETSP0272-20121206/16509_1 /TAXON_ID=71861 /ORGANISM="Scrippsiella trochoidea, Strain CCMP3099" /LENGTH=397 /DNA_ID=CAMNT_0003039123 /DNA_START=37 /DNA_END=1230 /DNA_ORIENTATION=-
MSWDTWQSGDLGTAAQDAKRLRTAEWNGGFLDGHIQPAPSLLPWHQQQQQPAAVPATAVAAWSAVMGGFPAACPVMPQLQASPSPAPVGGSDITQRIMDALKSHAPNHGSAAAATGPSQPGGSELGSMLLDSLRTLSSVGGSAQACQNSEEGQQLFRVMQNLGPSASNPASPPELAPAAAPALLALPAPEDVSAPAAADSSPPPATAAPTRSERRPRRLAPPRPEASPHEDEDADSDDGVPHRLPPGFGAIPEDIVEERARQREEQRILQLKATQPCRFGKRCKKRDCPNAHPEGRDIDSAWNPCAFGRRCKRKGCFYDHPEGRIIDDNPEKGMCKFGIRCSRPDCLYDHPEGRAPLSGPDPRICYFCHDPGHIATDCPRNPGSVAYRGEVQGQLTQ